jgi:ankyrin repeat protein
MKGVHEQLKAEAQRVIAGERLSDRAIGSLLEKAHINGMTEIVNMIIQEYPKLAKRFFASLTTFASTAIPAQQHEVETAPAEDGKTALHIAAQDDETEVVKLLLDKGANINQQDNNGKTALHIAAQYGETKVVELLLDRNANIDQQDNNGKTALHIAAECGETEVVKLLLDRNANIDQPDNNGKTALHIAAECGETEVVKLLLDRNANIDQPDNNGKTALHIAAQYGETEVVKLLLDRGADINQQDNNGKTARHIAAQYGETEVAKLLLDKCANINQPDNNLNSHSISPAASIGSSYRGPDENKEHATEDHAAPADTWQPPAVTIGPSAQSDIENTVVAPAAEPQEQAIG